MTRGLLAVAILCASVGATAALPALAQDLLSQAPSSQLGLPPQLKDVGFKPTLNAPIPLDLVFNDENGQPVKLRDFFQGKPVILAPVYYRCPILCNQLLKGLVGSLKMVTFNAGDQFEVVVVSFDPRETPAIAAAKKQDILSDYRRSGENEGWHFLTGSQASITALTQSIGFRYVWDAQSNLWAHASGIVLLTPQGKISRYFYGIDFSPRDMRLGLIEASHEKIGNPVDEVLLFCCRYDPATGKYSALVSRMLAIGGALTMLGIGAIIFLCVRRARHMRQLRASGAH